MREADGGALHVGVGDHAGGVLLEAVDPRVAHAVGELLLVRVGARVRVRG